MDKPIIKFQSYNPYKRFFPNFRVVSREEIELIKFLRLQGYQVIVEPNNDEKLVYVAQKGWYELLTNPLVLFILGMPTSFLMSHLANIFKDFQDRLKLKEKPQGLHTLMIEFNDNGVTSHINEVGNNITLEEFLANIKQIDSKRNNFEKSLTEKPNAYNEPFPIHLEHSDRIVGWAENLEVTAVGIEVKSIHITDDEIWNEIESGELQGLSVGGLVLKSTCMICKEDYVTCDHITSFIYDDVVCTNRIDDFRIGDVSIVKNPANPLAKLRMVKDV